MISKDLLSRMPRRTGVYLMKDKAGKVVYVGKANNLQARVRSYFNESDARYSVRFIVEAVCSIETIVTEDERQALILEGDLIRKFKPRYNVRLKDDRAPLLVRIDEHGEWPRIELVRSHVEDGARYIGPFAFSYELRAMLETIQSTLLLRTCSDKVLHNRIRPCLDYQIKRCCGPCCIDVDRKLYESYVQAAISILEGKNTDVIEQMEREMQRASDEMRYEDAASLRDRIGALTKAGREGVSTVTVAGGSKDCLGLYREGNRAEFTVLKVRNGRLFEAQTFGLDGVEVSDRELLSALLMQYYDVCRDIPEEILVGCEMEDRQIREELLSERIGRRVKIVLPLKGAKARVLALAQENSYQNFRARCGVGVSWESALRGIQRAFGLSEMPRIIDCVDISHFQGGATVGSVVSFCDGSPHKERYRHFHVHCVKGKPDDFASITEVLRRYLSACLEQDALPDLMIVDGGRGQLSQALKVKKELALETLPVVGLAKRRKMRASYGSEADFRYRPERIYLENEVAARVLEPSSSSLRLLERIRDEAHRFGISFHRSVRGKRLFVSRLDKIHGVGPRRRKELLREFGDVQSIASSKPEELVSRCKMPMRLARRIIDSLSTKSVEE
ncbi:MAG: excinuclease ABC subunit UvrC [Deltaproteobacteria bacterium]|nr:excinuclease ABC subunit UvrC [Deltaproteobacteria bacterium]